MNHLYSKDAFKEFRVKCLHRNWVQQKGMQAFYNCHTTFLRMLKRVCVCVCVHLVFETENLTSRLYWLANKPQESAFSPIP